MSEGKGEGPLAPPPSRIQGMQHFELRMGSYGDWLELEVKLVCRLSITLGPGSDSHADGIRLCL